MLIFTGARAPMDVEPFPLLVPNVTMQDSALTLYYNFISLVNEYLPTKIM